MELKNQGKQIKIYRYLSSIEYLMIHLMYYIIDIKRVGSHRGPSELLTNDDCPLRFRTLLNVTRNLGSSRLRLRVDTTP